MLNKNLKKLTLKNININNLLIKDGINLRRYYLNYLYLAIECLKNFFLNCIHYNIIIIIHTQINYL